jgi:hypothetical protein
MARHYYTLIERDPETKTWSPQFGDYDRNVVVEEGQSMHDSIGFTVPKGTKFKIIKTSAKQDDINAAVAALNH